MLLLYCMPLETTTAGVAGWTDLLLLYVDGDFVLHMQGYEQDCWYLCNAACLHARLVS